MTMAMAASMRLKSALPFPSLMVNERAQKRRLTNETLSNDAPVKRKRRRANSTRPVSPNFPPSFYDELSEVVPTVDVLRELDRRNRLHRRERDTSGSSRSIPKSLARFARHGGADTSHLRGYLGANRSSTNMYQTPSGSSRGKAMQASGRPQRSSAYDKAFQQHLIDYKIYPEGYEPNGLPLFEPSDLDSIQEALSANRASLSPSRFTQAAFQDFKNKNRRAVLESDVMRTIVPILCGDSDIISQQNILFTELQSVTSAAVVKPQPDLFDGVSLIDIDVKVRNDPQLKSKIIPTTYPNAPVVVNFFLEVKGPEGSSSVAKRQACLDGAYGARAMHALQNYGVTEPVYDGNAYSFSSIYHPSTGALQLYAHYITAPALAGGRPEYHMNKIRGFDMTDNRETFTNGARAFQNARQLAKDQRDRFVQAANKKAAEGQSQIGAQDGQPTPWQDAHDALQNELVGTCTQSSENDAAENDPSVHLPAGNDAHEPKQEPVTLGDASFKLSSSSTCDMSNGPQSRFENKRSSIYLGQPRSPGGRIRRGHANKPRGRQQLPRTNRRGPRKPGKLNDLADNLSGQDSSVIR